MLCIYSKGRGSIWHFTWWMSWVKVSFSRRLHEHTSLQLLFCALVLHFGFPGITTGKIHLISTIREYIYWRQHKGKECKPFIRFLGLPLREMGLYTFLQHRHRLVKRSIHLNHMLSTAWETPWRGIQAGSAEKNKLTHCKADILFSTISKTMPPLENASLQKTLRNIF